MQPGDGDAAIGGAQQQGGRLAQVLRVHEVVWRKVSAGLAGKRPPQRMAGAQVAIGGAALQAAFYPAHRQPPQAMACHLRLVNQVGDQLLYGGTGSGMGQIAQQLQHLHCAWRLAHGHGLAGFAGHDLGNVLRLYGAQDLQDLQQLAAGERGCAACPVARKGSAAPAQAFQRQIEFPG